MGGALWEAGQPVARPLHSWGCPPPRPCFSSQPLVWLPGGVPPSSRGLGDTSGRPAYPDPAAFHPSSPLLPGRGAEGSALGVS